MSYTKQTWTTGDTITAEKLNHIEEGIGGTNYIEIDLGDFSQLTAEGKCALFDECIRTLESGGIVRATTFGTYMIATYFSYSETDGEITSGSIGTIGTNSIATDSVTIVCATVDKANGDVTYQTKFKTIT